MPNLKLMPAAALTLGALTACGGAASTAAHPLPHSPSSVPPVPRLTPSPSAPPSVAPSPSAAASSPSPAAPPSPVSVSPPSGAPSPPAPSKPSPQPKPKPPPSVKAAPPSSAKPTPSPKVTVPTASRSAVRKTVRGESRLKAYTTGYTWWDNTPAGSAAISTPVLHKTASGRGTFEDPITLAVGKRGGELVVKAGTRFYFPHMQRYFVVEDHGGGNMLSPPGDAALWLDMWLGGGEATPKAAHQCTLQVTGHHEVIINPAKDYPVSSGFGVLQGNACAANFPKLDLTSLPRWKP